MIVQIPARKFKCDSSGCHNKSDYVIVNKKFVFDGSFYLCSDCLNQLYKEISKFITPKNVKPLYKKGEYYDKN